MPEFEPIKVDEIELPANCTAEDVRKFEELYRHHCESILDLVVGLQLNSIQTLWMRFWRSSPTDAAQDKLGDNQTTTTTTTITATASSSYYEDQLPSERFFALCESPHVCEFVTRSDFLFYQFCVEILIPDVFGMLPSELVSAIRNMSKSMEGWLARALHQVPEKMRSSKLAIIRAFSMTLKRYTSLSHLMQTVKNTLQNEGLLVHMSTDINKVDFSYIRVSSFIRKQTNKWLTS